MLDASAVAAGLRLLAPDQLRTALENFLPQGATPAERMNAIEAGLRSPAGQSVRDAMARWIVDEIIPVDTLVPDAYKQWRPPVRDAMKIRESVAKFLDQLPASRMPSGADAMRFLERVAIDGVKFPSSLIMLSKVMFTLEGILGDIVGSDTGMGFTLARHVAQHWIANRSAFRSPLMTRDWFALQCSALLFTSRLWLQWERALLNRLPGSKATAAPAATGTKQGSP